MPLVLVMAVGPGECLDALNLLDSTRAFHQGPYRVIIVDDSAEIGTWRAVARYPEVDLLHNWHRRSLRHLVASLQRPYRHVLTHYDFEAILKVETDALIMGRGPDADILASLRAQPTVGSGIRPSPTSSRRPALLQVPIAMALEHTVEDPAAVTEADRIRLFGDRDHVRLYAPGGYVLRLEPTGFRVTPRRAVIASGRMSSSGMLSCGGSPCSSARAVAP